MTGPIVIPVVFSLHIYSLYHRAADKYVNFSLIFLFEEYICTAVCLYFSTMVSMMKAVRFHGQKDLRIEDIPVPEVKKGQVKVGVCQ